MTKKKNSTEKKDGTRQSMSVGSQTLCNDDECVGKITPAPDDLKSNEKKEADAQKAEPGTSMSFGDQTDCKDDECIGKK